jgi:hypothetical protein
LTAKPNRFNPFRKFMGLKHWIVALSPSELPNKTGKGMVPPGDMIFLELTRDREWAHYDISTGELETKDIKLLYIGSTMLSEDQIEDRGTQLT